MFVPLLVLYPFATFLTLISEPCTAAFVVAPPPRNHGSFPFSSIDWDTGRLFDPDGTDFDVDALFVWTGTFDPDEGAFVPDGAELFGAAVCPNPDARAHAVADDDEDEHATERRASATRAIIPDELSPPFIIR
jgi:hypothetical protein